MTHPSPKRNMVPKPVLMKYGIVSRNTGRQVNTARPKTTVNNARPMINVFNKAHSTVRRTINNKTATKNSNFNQKVNTARPKAILNAVKGNQVNVVKASTCWVWKPKTKVLDHVSKYNSASITLKKFDYENPQMDLHDKGVIDSGCSRNMTGNMSYLTDFEVIDRGYVAFGGNPKGGKITSRGTIKTGNLDFENLTDESHVLLKLPRKNNMYSVDLKNVVPKGGLTCLFAKSTSDESKLWHRRLGHINFKTMNKLVKGNLVRGLPSKLFENDQTCVACQKGKQHRASCKSKTVSSISQPLHMLHMDLFGPTFVKSLMKKMYCLVVTDDYSRFSWVFFLATKDETSGILKSFITGVENLIDQRVKVIRCDNGTEFKNKEMNQFCERKGIKREFSVARTPQQNGVAERKNRTLIEAARTMLADSKLPTTFWAEAVNTACYVQNRVLVTKPHNKTPYELFLGRKPALGFMRPFGCPVTILNTIDHLGKFDGKADKGFFVGYSINSKAFRVFNNRTRIVEENLHIQFSENTPNIAGSTKACDDAGKARMETVLGKDYILLPLWTTDPPFSQNSKSSPDAGFKPSSDDVKKVNENPKKESEFNNQEKDKDVNSTNTINVASTNDVNAFGAKTSIELPIDPDMPDLEDIIYSDDNVGAEAGMNNLDEFIPEELLQFKLQEVWTLVELPNRKRAIGTKWVFKNKKDERGIMIKNKEDWLLKGLQVKQKEDGIFISQDKYVTKILKKFVFTDVKIASTPMETQKPLLKNEDDEEVDVHLYRLMISSLMYLTSSRLDIMFAVCAYTRYQVNPKVSHLRVVKRIFSLDRKSTIGEDVEGIDCLPNATIFEELTRMGYKKLLQKLTFYKAFFSPQWKFLIHTILQCVSAKSTASNEFSSTMASIIICLATNQKFNFSKYIFESMAKNLENVFGKFLMYPRFVQVFLDKQLEGMAPHDEIYIAPSHTKKNFANMRRLRKGFSGRETPLFPTMIVQAQAKMGEDNVTDEAVNEEMDDSLKRAATTATSLDLQAEEEEEERLAREKYEASVALIEEWNDIQAKIEADQLLAERLQAREQEELTIKERVKLFQQLLEKRRKFFTTKRAEEKRNRPPTRAQ
ncbi:putative ribonuclease H-like domain-containing protein [Tanacetum coccineum]